MSLHAPFLVKQYLSNDVESGSYSRIFWYYPLDRDRVSQGGIGLFFEVLSGDVEDDVYEQITKRFWDSFTGSFYLEGFEPALKKSIRMFIQLLRNFSVEEGLDVNIVLLNVVESTQGYTLKLISFGDSDVFVVREGKFADMSKMVPVNESLYDLKFLEVELDRGDILMLGNKTLLRNAFETDMLGLNGLDDLLSSLELFKENLFGSKKLFLVAATEVTTPKTMNLRGQKIKESARKVAAVSKQAGAKLIGLAGNLLGKLRTLRIPTKEAASKVQENPEIHEIQESTPTTVQEIAEEPVVQTDKPLDMLVEDLGTLPVEKVEKNSEMESDDITWPEKMRQVKPPPVDEVSAEKTSLIENETAEKVEYEVGETIPEIIDTNEDRGEQKVDELAHLVDPVEPLPEKPISTDDFVVSAEVTPAMVVEKSEYKELIDEATAEEELKKDKDRARFVSAPTLPTKGVNYVGELRARHSAFGKFARHPLVKLASNTIGALWGLLLQKVLKLFGKEHVVPEKKLFLARPTMLEKGRKVQPGVILILAILIITVFFVVRANLKQRSLEKTQLAEYQAVVAEFSTFYETNISIIDTEDRERQLELCAPEAEKVYVKETSVLKEVETEKNLQAIAALTSQVKAKVAECQSKYDRIYGIVRIKDAELITDFRVSLGNDSDISAISLHEGGIVVADKGRKAVYQIKVDSQSVMKMEDPLGLVVEPLTVGTGQGTLFVCDRVNGVLYYSKNASGNQEGFNRVVGAEPTTIGECAIVEGFQKNAYVVPNTANVVYKIAAKSSGGFEAPVRYIQNLLGVRSLSIDGFIYVVSSLDGKGNVTRYYGGKLDSFAIPQSADLGELTASYTNPSAERNLYVYDKTKNAVLSIEKPNSKHPGRGVVEKIYLLENPDNFSDIRSIAVNLNVKNQEDYMYILSGTTIRRFRL